MLSFKLVLKVAFLASLASTSPLAHTKRTEPPTGEVAAASSEVKNDVGILNFALTLEHLEHQFYLKFLHRFGEQDFRRANIPNPTQTFQNFHHILQHEAQHVKTLQAVITSLGGTPLPPCKYDFGVDDVHGYMLLARNLEKVGVSAYDGAVALLNSPDLQTAAATIDTVEARHASFIATATGVDPFPEDFDVPLGGDQIVTLASAVIKECPFDIKSTLGAAPAGKLSLVAPHVVRAGREIKVKFDPGQNKPEDHFCGFLFSDKSIVSPVSSDLKCKVPRGCRGDIFVAILNKNEKLTMKNSVEIIVAGPIIVAVDTTIEDSCKKFVHGIDIEWKGYGIRQNKAYDVDVEAKYDDGHKSKDDSEYKSYEHSEVEESKEYPESDDHSKGKEWKDVEESKDHSKDDASKYYSEVDASKEHPKVEAPINHSEVDASSKHTEVDASASHTEVTPESNAYETPKVESVTAYRKRGLIWSPSGHAEMPLSDAAPIPYEAPMAPETADANSSHDDYSGEMQSADELNGWMAVSSEHAEVETNPTENADMEHENTENMYKATENNDMVDDNTDNSDMEHDDADKSDMEHDKSESSDMEHEDAGKSDMEHDNSESSDMEHENVEKGDMEHDDAENSDMEHDNTENSDMEHEDAEKSDMEHDDAENSDMEHDNTENSDMEHEDTEKSDMEHDDMKNNDMADNNAENSDMVHDKMDLGESGDKSETEVPLAVPTDAEPSVGENLPTAVAVYNAEETKIAAIPLATEATVPEAPKETNVPTASLPTEVTVSEAPKETSVPTTSPLPYQGAVPPAETQVPDAPLPIAGNDNKTEVDSTDDVIKALRVEVARVIAGESESDDTDDVLDNLEVDDEPASEDDGTEVLAADDDIDAASQIDNKDASDTGLSDSKISAADASNVVADLEAQLQTFAPQRKA